MRFFVFLMAIALGAAMPVGAPAKVAPKTAASAAKTACQIPWPQIFAESKLRPISGRPLIVIQPLRNDTAEPGDEWLSFGLAHLLRRYLATSPAYGVLLEGDAPQAIGAAKYKIGGLFQHTTQWLRIFVQLKDGTGELLAQWTVETPYPLHKQFFTGLKQAAQNIFSKLGAAAKNSGSKNSAALDAIANETEKVRAYENFVKGKMALQKYDPNHMEAALIWFDEAIREDNRYVQPYLGAMEAHGFLSLAHKQAGLSFNQDLEQLQEKLQTIKKKGLPSPGENRFLAGHVHFVTGVRALEKGEASKAASELQQALDLVVEDGVTAYHLSLAYDKMGKADLAAKYRQWAKEKNPCL